MRQCQWDSKHTHTDACGETPASTINYLNTPCACHASSCLQEAELFRAWVEAEEANATAKSTCTQMCMLDHLLPLSTVEQTHHVLAMHIPFFPFPSAGG
jgi:hypothetical protein